MSYKVVYWRAGFLLSQRSFLFCIVSFAQITSTTHTAHIAACFHVLIAWLVLCQYAKDVDEKKDGNGSDAGSCIHGETRPHQLLGVCLQQCDYTATDIAMYCKR